uniref:Immunoglobulin V-set domain-containing protein n=1 Tax=Lates calcarifer TaxID=8187 RepID=A0A4W6BNE3_LATCA
MADFICTMTPKMRNNVSSDDAGVYWCGLKSNDKYHLHVQLKCTLCLFSGPPSTPGPSHGESMFDIFNLLLQESVQWEEEDVLMF